MRNYLKTFEIPMSTSYTRATSYKFHMLLFLNVWNSNVNNSWWKIPGQHHTHLLRIQMSILRGCDNSLLPALFSPEFWLMYFAIWTKAFCILIWALAEYYISLCMWCDNSQIPPLSSTIFLKISIWLRFNLFTGSTSHTWIYNISVGFKT